MARMLQGSPDTTPEKFLEKGAWPVTWPHKCLGVKCKQLQNG